MGYNINIQKLIFFPHNESEQGNSKKILSITIASKNTNYLGINVTKYMQDLNLITTKQ